MNIHRLEMYHILPESWEGAEYCPIDRIGMGHLVVEESGVESKSARWLNPMNIHRTEMYLTPLESWEGAKHCPIDRSGIGCLAVEESGIESESARKSVILYSWFTP